MFFWDWEESFIFFHYLKNSYYDGFRIIIGSSIYYSYLSWIWNCFTFIDEWFIIFNQLNNFRNLIGLNWYFLSLLNALEIINRSRLNWIFLILLYFKLFENISYLLGIHSLIFYISIYLLHYFNYSRHNYYHSHYNNLYFHCEINPSLNYLLNWFFPNSVFLKQF